LNLQVPKSGAYKPAYKENPETTENTVGISRSLKVPVEKYRTIKPEIS
jgi:hypothetical protein